MKILIVDDDLSNLTLIRTVLENNGYEVVQATNGENALEILRSETVDLIISDILMPVMDGYHLCQECKSDPKLKNVPFIFCSGTYTDEKDATLSVKFGAEAFISKPFYNDHLLTTISTVMENTRNGIVNIPDPIDNVTTGTYKLYSERLINKLEEKMLDLDKEKMILEMEVAERRKVEERLRKSRSFAESLFNAAPGIVLILDPDGRIIRFNFYMEKVSGYFLEDVRGQYYTDIFSPKEGAHHFSGTAAARSSEEIPMGNISSIITKTGEKKEIMWFDSILKDEDGQTIGLLAVGQDVTHRANILEETAQARTRSAMAHFSDSVAGELDAISTILSENISLLETETGFKDKKINYLDEIKKAAERLRDLRSRLALKKNQTTMGG